MPKSPFDLDDGFEMPAVAKPTQAVKQAAGAVVKQTAQQAKQAAQAFVNQLYGGAGDTQVGADDQKTDTANPLAQPKPQAQAGSTAQQATQTAQTPEEQAKIEKARRELQQTHTASYVTPTLGRIDDLEADLRKEAEKRKQEDQKRAQEDEQEKMRKAQEAQRQSQEFSAPAGKAKGGRNRMKQPIAVTMAKTKTEINRGATG